MILIVIGCLLASAAVCGILLVLGAKRTVRIEEEEAFYRELSLNLRALPKEIKEAHLQLRIQFEEKSKVLSDTRKALFSLEGEHFALRKDYLEKEHQPNETVSCLQKDLQILLEENESLKKEISTLEQIISSQNGENFMTLLGDDNGVLPLSRRFPIGGARGPSVRIKHSLSNAGVDHRLNRENHSGS